MTKTLTEMFSTVGGLALMIAIVSGIKYGGKADNLLSAKIFKISGLIFLVMIVADIAFDITPPKKNPAPTPPPKVEQPAGSDKKFFGNGQFKVGTDIPAGEYIAIGTGYVEVSTTPEGGSSIVVNDNIVDAQRYVTAQAGEYVKLTGDIKLYPSSDAPKIKVDKILPAGQFKCGTDISAGEYKISLDAGGYFAVTRTTGNDYVKNQFTNEGGNFYATVADGQFLQIKKGTGEFVGAAQQPSPAKVLTLGMTLEQFKEKYNATVAELSPEIDWDISNMQYKPGENQSSFLFAFNENVVMIGTTDTATGQVREVLISSTPKNQVDSAMAMFAYAALISTLSPELNQPQRQQLLNELKLGNVEQLQQLIQGASGQVVCGNVKYRTNFIQTGGMFNFGASAKDI